MSLTQTVAPTAAPVTLSEFKAYMQVTHSDSDAVLRDLIDSATGMIEDVTNRQIVTATWELRLDRFPPAGYTIRLPRPPLASVSSIQYVDPDGATQVWGASNYVVSNDRGAYGELWEAYAQSWPDIRDEREAVRITFIAGQAVASVPQKIKTAVCAVAQQLYDFPGEAMAGQLMEIASTRRLIDSLRLPTFDQLW